MAKVLHRLNFHPPVHVPILEIDLTIITKRPRLRLSLQPVNFYHPLANHTTINSLCPVTQFQTQIPQIQQLVCLSVKLVHQLENTVMANAIRLLRGTRGDISAEDRALEVELKQALLIRQALRLAC